LSAPFGIVPVDQVPGVPQLPDARLVIFREKTTEKSEGIKKNRIVVFARPA